MTNRFKEITSDQIINYIFNQKRDYSEIIQLEDQAQIRRDQNKERLIKIGFNDKIFYLPQRHKFRMQTIFYDIVYGYESQLAGTGLREQHFIDVCHHNDFARVVKFILPEIEGKESWDFSNENQLKNFCTGIFNFNIRSYKETMPIRLATYFYPDALLPIFRIDELRKICKAFGFEKNSKDKGEQLFLFNSFLLDKMKGLNEKPNIIKQKMAYQVFYTIELLNRLNNGEIFENVLLTANKKWEKGFYNNGMPILEALK